MNAQSRLVDYFGLDGDPSEGGRIPRWQGRPKAVAWIAVGLWLVLALAAYALLRWRMPAEDGFGGFVPLLFAVTVWIAGVGSTERALLRRS